MSKTIVIGGNDQDSHTFLLSQIAATIMREGQPGATLTIILKSGFCQNISVVSHIEKIYLINKANEIFSYLEEHGE